jgi:hypothetical protein
MVAERPIRTAADLTTEERALLASPYGFSKYFLGLPVMDKPSRVIGTCSDGTTDFYQIRENDRQKQVLDAIEAPGSKVSARTANGAGKTTVLIPGAVLWFMATHPRGKVVLTSGVERQVRAQLFPALHAHRHRLGGWKFNDADIAAPNGSIAIGFSTNDGARFEGFHGNKNPFYDLAQHDGPLMIVADEAKSIAQTIFDAIDRCTYQHLLLASSCGGSAGEFYRSHTSAARFYKTFQIAAEHCPYADHEKNRELIEKRGISDPFVRSKVFAEFMEGAEGSVIQAVWIDRARNSPPSYSAGDRRIFCDFAAGGDENAIAERQGNRVRLVSAWREKDTMRACGQFIDHFRKLGVTQTTAAGIIAGDEGGLGKVMLDRLAELGWQLQRVNNGAEAENPKHYRNHSAETWFEAAAQFEKGQIILENCDDRTAAQLSQRLGFTPSDGKKYLESKEDMRERGLDSPDRADALVGAMRRSRSTQPVPFAGIFGGSLLEQMIEKNGVSALPAGCDCN